MKIFLIHFFSEPIAMNSSTVVCPFIDVIAYDTFEYRAQDEGARGTLLTSFDNYIMNNCVYDKIIKSYFH